MWHIVHHGTVDRTREWTVRKWLSLGLGNNHAELDVPELGASLASQCSAVQHECSPVHSHCLGPGHDHALRNFRSAMQGGL